MKTRKFLWRTIRRRPVKGGLESEEKMKEEKDLWTWLLWILCFVGRVDCNQRRRGFQLTIWQIGRILVVRISIFRIHFIRKSINSLRTRSNLFFRVEKGKRSSFSSEIARVPVPAVEKNKRHFFWCLLSERTDEDDARRWRKMEIKVQRPWMCDRNPSLLNEPPCWILYFIVNGFRTRHARKSALA